MRLLKYLLLFAVVIPQVAIGAVVVPLVATTTSGTIFASPAPINNVNPVLMSQYFFATSTKANWFPYASSTALSSTWLCLGTDCRNIWPTGAAFGWTPTTFGSTAANSTSTLIGFTQGLYALASSTIGNGTQTGGLTINGGATSTGFHIYGTPGAVPVELQINNQSGAIGSDALLSFYTTARSSAMMTLSVIRNTSIGLLDMPSGDSLELQASGGRTGIATATPGTLFSIGNTGANTINISPTATSTFGSGINIRTGCFAVNGVCVTSGSGSGASSTLLLDSNTFSGTNIFATTTVSNLNGVIIVDGTRYPATGAGVSQALTTCKALGCGGVYVPQGTYIFSTSTLAFSGEHLSGSGASTTIFRLANGANSDLITNFTASGLDDVHISGISFDGNGANQTGAGRGQAVIDLEGNDKLLRNIHLDHISVGNCYQHCVFFSGENTSPQLDSPKSIEYSYIYNWGVGTVGFGVYQDFAPNTTVAYNTLMGTNQDDAIEDGHLGKAHIIGNHVYGGQIQFPFGSDSDIVDNWEYNNTIQNDNNTANGMVITGNHVLDASPTAGFAGISVNGASSTISNNYVISNAFSGIRIYSSNGGSNIITNNEVISTSSATTNGIYLELGSNNIVTGNNVSGFQTGVQVVYDNNTISQNTFQNLTNGVVYSDTSSSGHIMTGNYTAFNQMNNVTNPFVPNNQSGTTNQFVGLWFGSTGFGTSTPASPLTVYGSTSTALVLFDQKGTGKILDAQDNEASIFFINSNSARATPNKSLVLEHTEGASFFQLAMTGDTSKDEYTFNSDSGVGSYKAIEFEGKGASLLKIGSNGFVGFATSTPGSELSVQGNEFIAGNITSTSTLASVFPYASTTAVTATTASTTNLIVSSAGGTAGCATFDSIGTLTNTHTACGTGSGSSPFSFGTLTFGTSTIATSTSIWLNGGSYFSSSTVASQFPYASTTVLSVSNLVNGGCVQASTGGMLITMALGCQTGTVTRISTTYPLSGGDITTTGTLTFNGLATSGPWTIGQLGMVTDGNHLSGVSTSTVSNGTAISVSGTGSVVGSGLTINFAAPTTASLSIPYASSSAITAGNLFSTTANLGNATSTSLAITSITSTLLKTDGNGSVIPAIAGTDYLTGRTDFSFGSLTFSTSTVATSTSVWLNGGSFFSSSTVASQFPYASTTALSSANVVISSAGQPQLTINNPTGGNINFSANVNGHLNIGQPVGLNVADPGGRLGVNGSISAGSFSATAPPTNGFIISGNIGIATTTPAAALGIQGNEFIAGNITSTSTLSNVFPYASSTMISMTTASTTNLIVSGPTMHSPGTVAAPAITFLADLASGIYQSAVSTLSFVTGGLERMTISAKGFVGVGTTAPWGQFTVASSTPDGFEPIMVVASSTGMNPFFIVSATTTGNKNWARVAVGTSTTSGLGQFWPFTVQGEIYSTKRYINCEDPIDLEALTADTTHACEVFSFDENSVGGTGGAISNGVATGDGTPAVEMWAGLTASPASSEISGDGAQLVISRANSLTNFATASTSPSFEAYVAATSTNATSTQIIVGLTSNGLGTSLATPPGTGFYFIASSSQSNWMAVAQESSQTAVTAKYANTGVASTSAATKSAITWQKLSIHVQANADRTETAYYYINDVNVATLTTAALTSTSPQTGLGPTVAISKTASGLATFLWVSYIRAWADLLPNQTN